MYDAHFYIRVKERAYYMYINNEYNSDMERYLHAFEIEKTLLKETIYQSLTPQQIDALKYIDQQCQSWKHEIEQTHGFEICQNIRNHVQNAPLFINFPPDIISLLADDTHYRNQFETGTCFSREAYRVREEEKMASSQKGVSSNPVLSRVFSPILPKLY